VNYLFLKNILDSLFGNFVCPHCQAKPREQAVFIDAVSATTIDVRIHCSECSNVSTLKAELTQMTGDFLNSAEGKTFIDGFMRNQKNAEIRFQPQHPHANTKKIEGLSEADIQAIEKNIQPHSTIQDLIDGQ